MDEATPKELSVESLTRRILTLNFAAIHTSSMVPHLLVPSIHHELTPP